VIVLIVLLLLGGGGGFYYGGPRLGGGIGGLLLLILILYLVFWQSAIGLAEAVEVEGASRAMIARPIGGWDTGCSIASLRP